MDAARRDKHQGNNRFDEFDDFDKALDVCSYQFRVADEWLDQGASVIQYKDLVANPKELMVNTLNRLSLDVDEDSVRQMLESVDPLEVPEFNKGIPDRYLKELSLEQLQLVENKFVHFIDKFKL